MLRTSNHVRPASLLGSGSITEALAFSGAGGGWHADGVAVKARATPRQRIASECLRRGRDAVIAGCVDLLEGRDVDDALVVALGGPPAPYVLSGGAGGRHGYWPRSWAARGLFHVWDDRGGAAVVRATEDAAWRVREMALKVIARHRLGEGMAAALELRTDPVPRVRAAAERAVVQLTAHQS